MDRTIYKSHKKESKRKRKDLKEQYKKTRSPFKKRVRKVVEKGERAFFQGLSDVGLKLVDIKKKTSKGIHKNRNNIKELNIKLDYIVNSLKASVSKSSNEMKVDIENIVEAVDNL